MLKPPTPLQLLAWSKMDELTLKNKYPPSVRELMVALKWNSTSATFCRLERGVKDGRVVKINGSVPHYVPAWWHRMVVDNVEKYHDTK